MHAYDEFMREGNLIISTVKFKKLLWLVTLSMYDLPFKFELNWSYNNFCKINASGTSVL